MFRPGFCHPSGLLKYQGRRRLHGDARHYNNVHNGLSTYPYRRRAGPGACTLCTKAAAHTFIARIIYAYYAEHCVRAARSTFFFVCFVVVYSCVTYPRANFFFTPSSRNSKALQTSCSGVHIGECIYYYIISIFFPRTCMICK